MWTLNSHRRPFWSSVVALIRLIVTMPTIIPSTATTAINQTGRTEVDGGHDHEAIEERDQCEADVVDETRPPPRWLTVEPAGRHRATPEHVEASRSALSNPAGTRVETPRRRRPPPRSPRE